MYLNFKNAIGDNYFSWWMTSSAVLRIAFTVTVRPRGTGLLCPKKNRVSRNRLS